jgi:hypothetical protein
LGEVVVVGGAVELAELAESAEEEQDEPTRAADRKMTHPIRTAARLFDRFMKRVMLRE